MIFCFMAIISCNESKLRELDSKIDYSLTKNWLSLPTDNAMEVDVFYVYPTAWYKEDANEPNFCAIDNRIMLIGSKQALDRQATAFETVGNMGLF